MRPSSAPTGWSASSCFWVPSWIACYDASAQCAVRGCFGAAQALGATEATAHRAPRTPTPSACPSAPLSDAESEGALNRLPVILAITGASGAPYGVRLLEVLAMHQVPTWLMISTHGWRLLAEECGITDDRGLKQATGGDWTSVRVFDDKDRGAEPASGSGQSAGMVICPCSMGTGAAIAHGTSRSLIERAADVVLKERRRLVLVPRETPLSLVHLRNLTLA